MSTITKESIEDTIEGLEHLASSGIQSVYIDMAIAGMRRLQASLEAEPVAWIIEGGKHDTPCHLSTRKEYAEAYPDRKVTPLYTAPPAPVSVPDVVSWEDVPEEITEDDIALASAWAHGFNQCRAAMLQGAEPVTTAYKLPELRYLDTVKFNADCALQDPESIYAQEFFLSLDEVFGERGNYTEPVQAKAVSILIAEIFRLRGYPAAPQQEG